MGAVNMLRPVIVRLVKNTCSMLGRRASHVNLTNERPSNRPAEIRSQSGIVHICDSLNLLNLD